MTPTFTIRNVLVAALACFLASAFAGCSFSPEYPEGTIACNAGQANSCPTGFRCAGGFCRSRESYDGPSPREDGQAMASDGSLPDHALADGALASDAPMGTDLAVPPDVQSALDGPADLPVSDGGSAPGDLRPDLRPMDGSTGVELGSADTDPDSPITGDAATDTKSDANPGDAVDANFDAPACTDSCNPGDTRCASAGLQTCSLVNGCPAWGRAEPCTGRKTCQGAAPSATCTCPPPPSGCEGGAGSACVGNTLRTCLVGSADNCIYEDSSQDCPTGKPCQGTFPQAACTCPPAPSSCSAQGTYCESSTIVVTCGLDANRCLAATTRTACATDRPCTGAFPSANCSCGAGPAECGGTTGTACVGTGKIETCALNNTGCLAVSSIVDCPSGTTCQGTAPNAVCACPAPPTECSQGVGTACDAQGQLVTCGRDTNNCLVVAKREACPGITACVGTGPNARCQCPPGPSGCQGKGTACTDPTTLLTCSEDAQGCLTGAKTACDQSGKVCLGSYPSAACACVANPDCRNGAGATCLDDTTVLTCSLTSGGCLFSSKSTCQTGTYCSAGACNDTKSIGWYDDLGSKTDRTGGPLVLTPIKVDFPAVLRSFGILTRSEGTALVGLYDSNGDIPSKAIVANIKLPFIAGRNETTDQDLTTQVILQPGLYWIATTFKSLSTVMGTGSLDMSCRTNTKYIFGADFPSPWPEIVLTPLDTCVTSNFYILVSPLP